MMDYLEKWRCSPTTLIQRLLHEIGAIKEFNRNKTEKLRLHQAMRTEDCFAVPGDSFTKKEYCSFGFQEMPQSPDCLVCTVGKEPPFHLVECKYGVSMSCEGSSEIKVSDLFDDIRGKDSGIRQLLSRMGLPVSGRIHAVFSEDVAPVALQELTDYSDSLVGETFSFRICNTVGLVEGLKKDGVVFAQKTSISKNP